MRSTFHTLTLSLAAALAGTSMAQYPYTIIVQGAVTDCYPGQTVNIQTSQNTQPFVFFSVPVDANTCTFAAAFGVSSNPAFFSASTLCDGVLVNTQGQAAFNFIQDSMTVAITLDCGSNLDCMGVEGGPALPGTPCDDGNPQTGSDMWTPSCICYGVAPGDCWTLVDWGPVTNGGSPVPFEVMFNAYSIGAQPITYSWYFGYPFVLEGTSTSSSWQRTFAPGETMACQVIAVDADGCAAQWTNVEGSMNCDGILGSPNWPGLPCTVPGTTQPGIWSSGCICEADTSQMVDCEGNPGGNAGPGTPCVYSPDSGNTWLTGTWSVDCICGPDNTEPCQACFTFNSSAPFVVDFSNCSVLPSGENGMLWEFPDGSTYEPPPPGLFNSPSYTFDSAGVYPFCFTILDYGTIDGCSFCDTLYVDELGNVTSIPPGGADCLGVVNGSDLPGTPCTVPGTILEGTWNSACVCIPNNTDPCEADFWVIQAMGPDSLPVPYELWVWNLSSGGSGNFVFTWDFGDGTSSTEAFPTHTYSGNGPYSLCLTITDDDGCVDTHCDSVSINGDGIFEGMIVHAEDRQEGFTINVRDGAANGVQDLVANNDLTVWPNPATDELNMAVASDMRGAVTVTVTDLDGRAVLTERMGLSGARSVLRLGTVGLSPGMYVLRISDGTTNLSQRFVKTN